VDMVNDSMIVVQSRTIILGHHKTTAEYGLYAYLEYVRNTLLRCKKVT
jgi:hypothetical protein